MLSLIIPVYKNEGSLPALLARVVELGRDIPTGLEVIFVIDGSPDGSADWLKEHLPAAGIRAKVIELSRNFGSFAAIKVGLSQGRGEFFAVMAADLQEPPSLVTEFYKTLSRNECDVAIGIRENRRDPLFTRVTSSLFWGMYRRVVQKDMPSNGVDIFGCNRVFRDQLVSLDESNSSLVGLLFWLGFRRKFVPYIRREREHGRSAWTFKKKLRYLSDSVFAFSDLPIQLLLGLGATGMVASILVGLAVIGAKISGLISVPGYAATVLIILFFAGLNSLGLGVIGSYVWRAFENTKERPSSVVMKQSEYGRG
jgi:glycosyltransferase involved in cell wall biosynthesis